MPCRLTRLAVLIGMTCLCTATLAASSYTVVDLWNGNSGVASTAAGALNSAGQVAGRYPVFDYQHFDPYGQPEYLGDRAVLWSNGSVTELGTLGTADSGFANTSPNAINSAGQVVGYSSLYENGQFKGDRAVLWSHGGLTNLGTLGTDASGKGASTAIAINPAGQVVGTSTLYQNGQTKGDRAVLWSNGSLTNLGTLGTAANGYGSSSAVAVNAAGQVAGFSRLYENGVEQGSRAVLWSNGSLTNLGTLGISSFGYGSSSAVALNATGQVAGNSNLYESGQYKGARAVLWSDGGLTNLGSLGTDANGRGSSFAFALNVAGEVAGRSDLYENGQYKGRRAVLWSNGSLTNLGALGTDANGYGNSSAVALNADGQVVGYSALYENGQYKGDRAVISIGGAGFRDLTSLVDPSSLDGYVLTSAVSVADNGLITAYGTKSSGTRTFLLTPTPVPEPESLALFLVGFGLVVGLAQWRARRPAATV